MPTGGNHAETVMVVLPLLNVPFPEKLPLVSFTVPVGAGLPDKVLTAVVTFKDRAVVI